MATATITSQKVHIIVGGLGFLGRALQKQLLSHGKQVRVLDLAPSAMEAANRLVHPTSIEYVPCDLSSINYTSTTTTLHSALKDAETVYSVVTPDVLKASAAEMRRTNVDGVAHLLEACHKVGVPKLVYGSSMAATNQLVAHREDTEETPLPPWDTYKIAYDRTKRQGEELVVKAHSDGELQTCSLRLGTILAGPGDYGTRQFLESPGRVVTSSASYCAPMDMISSHDLAAAFRLASDKLDSSNAVGGKALFVTKCKSNQPTSVNKVAARYADSFQWPLYELPPFVLPALAQGYRALETVKGFIRSSKEDEEEFTAGLPFDYMVEAMAQDMTYDNSLARRLLDFEPQETWEDAVDRIGKEFRLLHPELFKK